MLKRHVAAAVVAASLLPAVFVLLLTGVKAGAAVESARSLLGAAMSGVTPPAPVAPSSSAAAPDAASLSPEHENQDAEHAAALDRLFSPDYHACMDVAAGVTAAMQECMTVEVERLEKHLVEERSRLVPALSQERAKALSEALDAWVNLRNAGAAALYDPQGGTLAPVIASLWRLEQTARMVRWLEELQESASP